MKYICIHPFNIYQPIDNFQHHLLVIENKKILFNFLSSLADDTIENKFVEICDEHHKKIKLSEYIDVVPSILNLSINNKKNITALIKHLKSTCNDILDTNTSQLTQFIQEVFNLIRLESSIEISSNLDISIDDLMKLMNLSIMENRKSLLEIINNYIKVTYELRNIKIFIFFGLFSFLEKDELNCLLNNISYFDIKIINIEDKNDYFFPFKVKKIIDNDICLIE